METTKKSIGSSIWRLNATLESVNDELMENGGELTPELEEALVNAELSQVEIVDGLHELVRMAKAQDEILSQEIKRLQGLKKARTNALDGLKKYLLNYMIGNGIQKIEGQFCKVSVAAGKESVSCDEAALVAGVEGQVGDALSFLPPYIQVDIKVSKSALLNYLKEDGAVIPTIKEGEVDVPLANIVKNPYLLIK